MSSITSPGIKRVPTDSGTAIPVGGALAIVGAGGITTSASGDTVTITGGGGGGGISTIDGDSGSATGSTVTFDANTNCGQTVLFDASGSTVSLKVTDANSNTYIGDSAGKASAFATNNTSLGKNTLKNVGFAAYCTMVGAAAGASLTDAQNCTGMGQGALNACTIGGANCCFGGASGASIVDGIRNSCLGFQSGVQVVSGNNSTLIGYQAGLNYTTSESYNICLGSSVTGTVGESNVMRLGATTGPDTIASTFIAGVAGVSVSNTQMVTINSSTGQLGSQSIPSGLQTWSVITANQSAVKNNGYFCNKSGSVCEVLLPATSAVGDTFTVVAMNSDGWRVTQGSGQQIFFGAGSTTLGATGYLAFNAVGDTATLVCRVANTEWQVVTNIGNITPS